MSRWDQAYGPLRARTLRAQLAVVVAAEILLFASYSGQQASFHWATHFLVAMTAWALAHLGAVALKGAPARAQLVTLLAWHLLAMFPDVLFRLASVPHDDWMDVFLGHIASHYVPGGAYLWLVVALTASALYAVVLAGWLKARRTEADAGMAPGVGLGGSHLVRPQRPPQHTALEARRYGPGRRPDVVLLHGLGASNAIWRPVAERLAAMGHAVLVPDLLGFGASRDIGTTFSLEDHVAALATLLEDAGAERPLLAGHSFGCAVAAAFAETQPDRARALVLVSPPAFHDPEAARLRLSERGWLARQVLDGTPAANLVCNAMCMARGLTGRLMPRVVTGVPDAVARDSVQHTWPAYRDAVSALLADNPVPRAIAQPRLPTTVILGDADPQTPPDDVLGLPHGDVRVEVWSADHLLPVRAADRLAGEIGRTIAAR